MTALALEDRAGLPDALRVLLEAYPRSGWTMDPGFDQLIRFWLDRHQMFRRLMHDLKIATQSRLDGSTESDQFARNLSRLGGLLVNQLHEHHTIEDQLYFPKLSAHDPRITKGFLMLDADHHALDRHLAGFITDANHVLSQAPGQDHGNTQTAAVLARLRRLDGLLDRHLTDEEDLIVPVILKFGSPH